MKLKDYLLKIAVLIDKQEAITKKDRSDCNPNINIFADLDGVAKITGISSCCHSYDGTPGDEEMEFNIKFYIEREECK